MERFCKLFDQKQNKKTSSSYTLNAVIVKLIFNPFTFLLSIHENFMLRVSCQHVFPIVKQLFALVY